MLSLLLVAISTGYVAVSGERLTLSEILLEFPTAALLELDKSDNSRGAFLFRAKSVYQGKPASVPLKYALLDGGKLPMGIDWKPGARIVVFAGSPDNRSLICAPSGWFLTKPDGGWERFTGFRNDMLAVCSAGPDTLGEAIAKLMKGGAATVAIKAKGDEKSTYFVRYDARYPHRREPLLAKPETRPGELLKQLASPVADVRQAAILGMMTHGEKDAKTVAALAKALADEDRFVCAAAARALGAMGDKARAALPSLVKALGERNFDHDYRPHRAAEAAEATVRISPAGDEAKAALRFLLSEKMLGDNRSDAEGTRTAAAMALGRLGKSAAPAFSALRERLGDAVPETRIAAAGAMLKIGGKAADLDAARKVLAKAMREGPTAARVMAIRVTGGELHAERAALVKDVDEAVRESAKDSIRD